MGGIEPKIVMGSDGGIAVRECSFNGNGGGGGGGDGAGSGLDDGDLNEERDKI